MPTRYGVPSAHGPIGRVLLDHTTEVQLQSRFQKIQIGSLPRQTMPADVRVQGGDVIGVWQITLRETPGAAQDARSDIE